MDINLQNSPHRANGGWHPQDRESEAPDDPEAAGIHPDMLPVWDAVCAKHPNVIAQMTGPDQGVGLEPCIRAFQTEAHSLGRAYAFRPDLLLGLFEHCPQGAYSQSVGTEPFIKEVTAIYEKCFKEVQARNLLVHRTTAAALLRRVFPPEEQLLGSLVTRTTRTFLVGPTGAGKTMLAMAMAGGIATGHGFLRWRSDRPARVLYIDGEMPLELLQKRMRDLARRLGYSGEIPNLHYLSWQEADGLLLDAKWAPLNTPEGQDYVSKLCDVIQPDVVFFDNVQSLILGDMKDEVPWNDTMPLVLSLTARSIGQVWCDHTGHDQSRQYGSSRKTWQFDTLMMILPAIDAVSSELALTLSFDKARRRTPDNWQDYAERIIRLREDHWTSDADADAEDRAIEARTAALEAPKKNGRGRPQKPDGRSRKAHSFLADLLVTEGVKGQPGVPPGLPSVSAESWKAAFYSRTTADPKDRSAFWRASNALIEADIVAKNGDRVWLTHPERDSI